MSNVMTDYHAVGDGSTDDTAAIQAAIDDANHNAPSSSSSSGVFYNWDTSVYFPNPPVYYKITGSLQLRGGVTLFGYNQWKGVDYNPNNYMLVGDGVNPIFVTGAEIGDTSLNRDITIMGLSAFNGVLGASGVYFGNEVLRLWSAYNFKLIQCAFTRIGLDISSSSSSSSATGSDVPGAAVSIWNSASGTIQDCYIAASAGPSTTAIGPWAVTAYDQSNELNCQNNFLTGGSGGGAVDIAGCVGVRINGSTIQSSYKGIRVCGIASQGECIGVNLDDNYMEAVNIPYDIGRINNVIGLSIQRGNVSNGACPSPENSIFTMGAVQGWKIGNGIVVVQVTNSTMPMINFLQNTGLTPVCAISGEASDIYRKGTNVNGPFYAAGSGFLSPAQIGYITGLNRMQPLIGWQTSGYRVFETYYLNAGVNQTNVAYVPVNLPPANPDIISSSSSSGVTGFGGVVDSVEVIEANGTLGCTVSIGTNASYYEIAQFNPSSYSYSSGVAVIPLSDPNCPLSGSVLYRGGGNYQMSISVAAGSGTGTFRIRVKYRGF